MLQRINQLWDRLDQQSRVTQWVVFALIGLVMFLLWSEIVDPMTREWAQSADRIEANVARVRAGGSIDFRNQQIDETVGGIGPIRLPNQKPEGQEKLSEALNAILQDSKYRVTDDSISIRPGSLLGRDAMPGVAGSGLRIRRVEADVRFTASQDHTMEILHRLESDPNIEGVGTLTLQKNGERLNVVMTVEAWVTESASRRDR